MGLYTIRFAKKTELDRVQNFINKYWYANHVMAISKELFAFQHDIEGLDYYTFVVAENNETHELEGVYGFIHPYKYDTTCIVPAIGWGAIWKVRKDVHNMDNGKLGLGMLKYILKNGNIESIASLGISPEHKKIAVALHFEVGEVNRYYICNNTITDFRIAKNPIKSPIINNAIDVLIKDVELTESIIVDNVMNPFKNVDYFKHRYEHHPFFKYHFWGIYVSDEIKAIIVVRKIDVIGSSCLRIIDAIGDFASIPSIRSEMQRLLQTNNAEYIDCLNHGIEEKIFFKMGFTKHSRESDVIIPEYFEPFEQKNVLLEYSTLYEKPLVIFKGDGDQDRPNIL